MKRILKSILRGLWRLSSPITKPMVRRLDARVTSSVAVAIHERIMPPIVDALMQSNQRLERIEHTLDRATRSAGQMAEEMELVLTGLSREVFRLQAQVEVLHRMVEGELERATPSKLTIVDESEEDEPLRRAAGSERSMVG
jgi:hypothetical protein